MTLYILENDDVANDDRANNGDTQNLKPASETQNKFQPMVKPKNTNINDGETYNKQIK